MYKPISEVLRCHPSRMLSSGHPLSSGLWWIVWLILSRGTAAHPEESDLVMKGRGGVESAQPGIVAGGKGQ